MPINDLAYGVRVVIRTICLAMALYAKHRERCIDVFPDELVSACDVLAEGCDVLRALNPRGPR